MATALAVTPLYDCVPATAAEPFASCFRYRVGPFPTTLLELVLLLALAAGLVAGGSRLPWRNPYTVPALVLLLAAGIGAVVAPDVRAGAGLWKAYFAEPVLAGLVIAWLAADRRNARLLLAGLAVAGAISAVANIAAFGVDYARHFDVAHQPPVALYRTANAVPLFLVPLQAFGVAIALYGDDRRERLLAGAFTALATVADLTSLSRGGWLGLVTVVVAAGLFHRRRLFLVGVPLLAGAVLAGILPPLRHRLEKEIDLANPDNTLTLRAALWRSDLNLLQHRPLFGAGLGGFRAVVGQYADPAYHEQVVDPHDLLLNWWTETGLLGLAAFTWLVVQVVRTARAGLAGGPWARALSIGLIAMIAAVVVHGLVDVPYFKNDLALEFWALVGIQLGALRPSPPA